jgi:transcriptional regulator with XRE-family HTH domain
LRGYTLKRILASMTLDLDLRTHRQKAGMTQAELAKAVGVRQATISDLETGKSRWVDLDLLEQLAKALGVKPVALLVDTQRKRR